MRSCRRGQAGLQGRSPTGGRAEGGRAAGRLVEIVVQGKRQNRLPVPGKVGRAFVQSGKRCEKNCRDDLQLARTEFPIRSRQKVVTEKPVLFFAQSPARDQREIRDKLLIFPSQVFGRWRPTWGSSEMRLNCRSSVHILQTGHSRSGKYSAARSCRVSTRPFLQDAIPIHGIRALRPGQGQCLRPRPLHIQDFLSTNIYPGRSQSCTVIVFQYSNKSNLIFGNL